MEPTRVHVPVETTAPGGGTNAYLVDGDEPLLVDPAARSDELTAAVEERGVAHVAVTHTHRDHVGAVEHYAGEYGATVWARAGREGRFERATGVTPDRTFREGKEVGPVSVLETPGHAPDHAAFVSGDAALVGDLAFAEGSVFVGGSDGDMRAYLTTLRRLRTRGFETLHPAHGPTVEDPGATLERLIRHRLDREALVLDAVRSGAETPDDIVDIAYEGEDLTGVRRLARLAVGAHLDKLAAEGSVDWDGEHARPA